MVQLLHPQTILTTTNPQKDQLLLSSILSSISEEVFSFVVVASSSRAVWTALAATFGAVSQIKQLQLNIELQELEKNDMPVAQYLQKAKFLADELSAAGRTLTALEFNAIIYRNTGIEFHRTISGLILRPEPVGFNELFSQLVSHEILLKVLKHLLWPILLVNRLVYSHSLTTTSTLISPQDTNNRP